MEDTVLIGGSGGQGVMLLGTLLATSAIKENKYSSCLPAYGPEMRGGTANCTVVISDKEVITPLPDLIDCMIMLNEPSYWKFKDFIKEGGLIILNSSLISETAELKSVKQIKIPFNDIALELGNIKAANMVALGNYLQRVKSVKYESVKKLISDYFKTKPKVVDINCKALLEGMKF